MMIPKIIHITWKDHNLSEKQNFIISRWRFLHPDFDIRFYTDIDNSEFMENYFPQYINVLNKLKRNVSKIDFIRLLYLYQFGGIYVDLDVLPLKRLDSFLNISNVILCKEDSRNAPHFKVEYIISNAIIIANKNNEFIKKIIDEIVFNIDSPKMNSHNTDDVLKMTGPLLFNKVYSEYSNKNDITLLESRFFNPMTLYDLERELISNDIGFSFAVHLFDGTWWQKKYNSSIELLKKIIIKHDSKVISYNENKDELVEYYKQNLISKFPLISCLCITKNDYNLVSISIQSFQKQIYPNKELVIVYEEGNEFINRIIKDYNDDNIKYIKVDINPKKTLGELRNISIQNCSGDYISQWDDDDWFSPLRLWEQFYHMKSQLKDGSILKSWLVYDNVKNNLYVSKRINLAGWEGSILYKKSKIKNLYDLLPKGEDTGFIEKIQSDLAIIDNPELYIYRIHSCNTWDYEKMSRDIIRYSKLYHNQLLAYNIFKDSCLKVINNQYCEVMINKENYSSLINIKKTYETGIVIPTFGRYEKVKRMIMSLKNSLLNNDIIIIFVDETNSIGSPKTNNWSVETEDLIKESLIDGVNIIKIFKKYHAGGFDSIKIGFDILTTDFNCKKLMMLHSDVIVKPDWYSKLNKNEIFNKLSSLDVILSGFTKDDTNEESIKVNSFDKDIFNNKHIGGINMFFKKEIYYKTRHLYTDKLYDYHISKYISENGGLLLSLKNSVIDHIGEDGESSNNVEKLIKQDRLHYNVASEFYYKINEIDYVLKEAKDKGEVPKIIHRLLLYDSQFPDKVLNNLKRFKKHNNEFYHVLWTENDLLSIMSEEEIKIYNGYSKKIQKSDYARYLVLKYYGGIYCDLDINIKKPFDYFFNLLKNKDLYFIETTLSDSFVEETKSYKIRKGVPEFKTRIANYIMMCKPESEHINSIIKLCEYRKDLKINEDYDIIYTTGPDVVSTYINTITNDSANLLSKKDSDVFFSHECHGHWRNDEKNEDLKISVIMQSYLGDYPGSRKKPKEKFIRAVNSFINQTNKNTELIIVSDGCKITFDIFYKNFSKEERIKFIYLDKESINLYQESDGKTFYRGKPRELGRSIATGQVITYMDSDDFILPEYLKELSTYWNNNKDLDWIINKSWYDNEKIKVKQTKGYFDVYETLDNKKEIKIEGLDSLWIPSVVKSNISVNSPALFSHKNNCDVKWQDSYTESEDFLFIKKIKERYNKNGFIKVLGYVRCHLKGHWDF